MCEKLYKSINDIIANNLVAVIFLPAVFFVIKREVAKRDAKYKEKYEKVYAPLYNMFNNIEKEYIYCQEIDKYFSDMDLQTWYGISDCESNLLVDKKLKKLINKFIEELCDFLKKWDNCVGIVIKQYNDIAKKVNGLDELCTEERKRRLLDYDREELLLQKFTFALLLKKYDMAFDYIVPEESWNDVFSIYKDEEKKDPRNLVLENKYNIISMIKNIKIEAEMLESYETFKKNEKIIMDYLLKELKK